MNQQNQNPQQVQTPPNQQQQAVPDHRVNELTERLRALEQQNIQLRQTIDAQFQRPQGGQQQNPSPFKPEVEQAIRELINSSVESKVVPLQNEFKNHVGLIYDQTDEARFMQQYGAHDRFQKFLPKVESIRRTAESQGRWISREQALQMAYFEETGKKPQAESAPVNKQPNQPVFSPYFNAYVDPVTGMPVNPHEAQTPENQDGTEIPQGDAAAQQMPWQQPAPQQQQQPAPQHGVQTPGYQPNAEPGQFGAQHPMANAHGMRPQLPGQSMNPSMGSQKAPGGNPMDIGLDATDADLEAFEQKFGEIEF